MDVQVCNIDYRSHIYNALNPIINHSRNHPGLWGSIYRSSQIDRGRSRILNTNWGWFICWVYHIVPSPINHILIYFISWLGIVDHTSICWFDWGLLIICVDHIWLGIVDQYRSYLISTSRIYQTLAQPTHPEPDFKKMTRMASHPMPSNNRFPAQPTTARASWNRSWNFLGTATSCWSSVNGSCSKMPTTSGVSETSAGSGMVWDHPKSGEKLVAQRGISALKLTYLTKIGVFVHIIIS